MEFMEGGTLAQALKAWTFKEPQIAYFAREVLRGLDSLHEVNCAHRDIKPHNIMLDVDGIVKLSTLSWMNDA
jgi:serine/threonine protein kinase